MSIKKLSRLSPIGNGLILALILGLGFFGAARSGILFIVLIWMGGHSSVYSFDFRGYRRLSPNP